MFFILFLNSADGTNNTRLVDGEIKNNKIQKKKKYKSSSSHFYFHNFNVQYYFLGHTQYISAINSKFHKFRMFYLSIKTSSQT